MAYTHFSGTKSATETADVVGWFTSIRSALARWVMYRRTVSELSTLSSRELADLGLNASMIASVAHQAAYGK